MVATLAFLAAQSVPTDLGAYLQNGFHDAAFTVQILRKDQSVLESINKDFGQSFMFDSTQVQMKEPYKLRLDAKVEDTAVSYVIDGPIQRFKVPKLRLSKSRDLSKLPASRQTTMDFGFLTPTLFGDLLDAKFVQADPAKGAAIFDLAYKPVYANTTHFRVWLDPVTRTMVRREWYNRTGKLLATFEYTVPKEEGGATLPTHMTVRNAAGELAGETRLDDVRVNRGVGDEVFKS